MGRVNKGPARQNVAAGSRRGAQTNKARRKQKVILQNSSKDSDGPSTVLSFRADPPPGYTFIPIGNTQLTAALKERARDGNHKIHSVSMTPHAARHELSREVHRIGFHFPTEVVAQVCAEYGIRLDSKGHVIDENKNENFSMRIRQQGQLVLDEKFQDQVTINTEAKETIRDLFPTIPDNDLFQIIKTAFQLGDGKVGTADEIPLVRRAALSVVAHIRHVYTTYDKLLRKMSYNEARHEVEEQTLQKLVEWRGDNDDKNGPTTRTVDDAVREVVVISDEDESDSGGEQEQHIKHDDLRVEELHSNAYWPQQGRPTSPPLLYPSHQSTAGHRLLPQVADRYRLSEAEIDARDRSRRLRWEQARQQYRSVPSQQAPTYERIVVREPSPPRRLIPLDPPAGRIIERQYIGSAHAYQPLEVQAMSSRQPSPVTRSVMPSPFARVPVEQAAPPRTLYRRSSPIHTESRPITPPYQRERYRRRSASPLDGRGTVVPSIEGPNGPLSPSTLRYRRDPDPGRMQPEYPRLPEREYVDLSMSSDPGSRRRHVENLDPAPMSGQQYYRGTNRDHVHGQGSLTKNAPPPTRSYIEQNDEAFRFHRQGANAGFQASALARPPPTQELRPPVQASQQRIIYEPYDGRNPFQDRAGYAGNPRHNDTDSRLMSREGAVAYEAPRRILEPIPSEGAYSQEQRYREYAPSTQSGRMGAPLAQALDLAPTYRTSERRIEYQAPEIEIINGRRYERLPGPTYVRP